MLNRTGPWGYQIYTAYKERRSRQAVIVLEHIYVGQEYLLPQK